MGRPSHFSATQLESRDGETDRALEPIAVHSGFLSPRWPVRDRNFPYASAVVLVLIAFAIRMALGPLLAERSPLLIFTAAIVIAAGRYGTAPGLVAMVLSLGLGTFVFIAPGYPPVLSPDEIASLAVFIVTSVAMLSFAGHLKASKEREAQLQAALQQVQTETAMGTMAATLAHELNQPLAAAANYVGACKRMAASLEGELQATLVSGLGEAEGQIHRAGEIIRHARNLVSSVAAVREPSSLRKMVGNVLKPLQASETCENIKVRMEIEPGANQLEVNPVQIEQVLLNLIRNACQAVESDNAAEILVSSKSENDQALVEVRDSGPGISEERMKTLFSPQGRQTDGGLGLGLSISRTIIEAHGGKMWAKNNLEGGASFFFTVPREGRPS